MDKPKESVFIASIRAFCKAFAIIIGICIALIPVMILFSFIFRSDYDLRNHTTLTVLPDLNYETRFATEKSPVILQIDITNVIGISKLNTQSIKDQLVDSRQGLLSGDRVKGILLFINTPGGSAIDSDSIYHLIKEYKARYNVPVMVYVEGLCASGGMYIACAADKIHSGPVGIIGSVGVINGPFFNFYEAMKKIGVSSETLTAGKDKDMFNPTKQWSENEGASIRNVTNYLYQRFVSIVAQNRPNLSEEALVQVYGANIYNPMKAKEYGYIDVANSSYRETVLDLMQSANIDPDQPYQIIRLDPKKSFFNEIVKAEAIFSGNIKHTISLNDTGLDPIQEQFSYLYLPYSSQ